MAGALDSFKYKHTPEDAENLAAELIPAPILADFGDANWKTRLAALEEMAIWIQTEIEALDAEVVVRALAKKGWSEKNFQVCFVQSPPISHFNHLSGIRKALQYPRPSI